MVSELRSLSKYPRIISDHPRWIGKVLGPSVSVSVRKRVRMSQRTIGCGEANTTILGAQQCAVRSIRRLRKLS